MTDTLASDSMMSSERARRITRYAAKSVGAVGSAGVLGLIGVLYGEAKLAEHRIPIPTDLAPPTDDTTWAAPGVSPNRPPIRLAILGDSSAAGYGALLAQDTPGARLALGISEAARRPVRVHNVAVIGAESKDLAEQVDELGSGDDLALIMIGANDVTERTKPAVAVVFLEAAVRRLRAAGLEVLVGTCPDLGVIGPIAQPLRAYVGHASRRMARAQTVAVVRAGGRTVSLGDLLGPVFQANPALFAADRFHPSGAGYRAATDALLPSALDALGVRTRARSASPFTTRRAKPVEKAAAQAVAHPGSEVLPTEHRPGYAGRGSGTWARLRRRRTVSQPTAH
jgi:lysophospholipase L1-like esterase